MSNPNHLTSSANARDAESDTRAHPADGAPDAIGPSGGTHAEGSGGTIDAGSTGGRAEINLDDDEIMSRGAGQHAHGTTQAAGADSGELNKPNNRQATSNGPSERWR